MIYKFALVLASVAALTAGCKKMNSDTNAADVAKSTEALKIQNSPGQVYTITNAAGTNQVVVYNRSATGALTYSGAYNSGGAGTGAGLGSQGAVALTDNHQWLLAVNAGSHSLSSFRVTQSGLKLQSTIASGGQTPVSVTVYKNLVYVVNAGGMGNIAGFQLANDGSLTPLAGSIRPLSSSGSGPAQISFVNNGSALVVTEKITSKIISYTLSDQGLPQQFHATSSANTTPFGFAVGDKGMLYVSEAAGGAPGASTVSLYQVNEDGAISLVTGPVSANQTAACWVAINNNNKYVYATNTGSNSVTSFASKKGLQVLEASIPAGTTPIDAAFSNNSKYLYVLNSGSHSVSVYEVMSNGGLTPVQTVTGVAPTAVGLAAN